MYAWESFVPLTTVYRRSIKSVDEPATYVSARMHGIVQKFIRRGKAAWNKKINV